MSRHPDPGSALEDAGIPDVDDVTPGERDTGDDIKYMDVAHDRPVASLDHGTTPEEAREGEPLDLRLSRELPDVTAVAEDDLAGRIVEPDQGGAPDEEKDAIGTALGADSGGLSPEERAMHVIDPEDMVLDLTENETQDAEV